MMLPPTAPLPTLLGQMNATPRWRRNGLPPDPGRIVVFAQRDSIETALKQISAHAPAAEIVGFHAHKGNKASISINRNGKAVTIPELPPDCMATRPECSAVLFWQDCVAPDLLYHLPTVIWTTSDIIVFPRVKIGEAGRKWDPEFYDRYSGKLERIYMSLADDESKLAFASVVKGIAAGDIEWPRPSAFPEYENPFVHAEKGDIIIDAGLFDSTVCRKFAMACGPSGHVYGFEPEPANHAFVLESLKNFGDPGNLTILKLGLWSEKAALSISDEGASGRICAACAGSSACEVTDLDSFVKEQGIRRVDLIKMDIEGAEKQALMGAAETIRRFRPKLQICAYHNINDLTKLPEIVLRINPSYKLHFTAHAPFLNEYVYYFAPERRDA